MSLSVERISQATLNVLIGFASLTGLALAAVSFYFYETYDLPAGFDDSELMLFEALALGVFGFIISFVTLGGTYWLNCGTVNFKVAFLGTILFIAGSLILLRGCLPGLEAAIGEEILAEYRTYHSSLRSKELVDTYQNEYHCCGYFGPSDFPSHRGLPNSCCEPVLLRRFGRCNKETMYHDPCKTKLADKIDQYFHWLDGVCFVTVSTLVALSATVLGTIATARTESLRFEKYKSI